MSDYTPDTEAVRNAYRAGAEPVFTGDGRRTDYRTQTVMVLEFERWLAEVKAAAWDEGYGAGVIDQTLWQEDGIADHGARNPYRSEW